MESGFRFDLTPPDPALLPQISRALRAYTDRLSRARYPRLWALTDRLNSSVQEPRQTGRFWQVCGGLINWLLGLFLLIPGVLALGELAFVFFVGALAFLAGSAVLWRSAGRLLGILSLAAGVLNLLGAAANPARLGRLGILGALYLAVGTGSLLFRSRQSRFDRAAQKLLDSLDWTEQKQQVWVTEQGLTLPPLREGEPPRQIPFREISCLVGGPALYLAVWADQVLLLPRRNLSQGNVVQLEKLLSRQSCWLKI